MIGSHDLTADDRLHAVRANQHVAMVNAAILQFQRYAGCCFAVARRLCAQSYGLSVKRADSLHQQSVQIGAVHHAIGKAVPAFVVFADRKFIDDLAAEITAREPVFGREAYRLHRRSQSEHIQNMAGIGADLNAGADFAEHLALFEDPDRVAAPQQQSRSRQPADPGADNQHIKSAHCPFGHRRVMSLSGWSPDVR